MAQISNQDWKPTEIKLPYRITGPVVHGKAKGRTVGMPTVNLGITEETALPPLGVYATLIYIRERVFMGVTNVGTRPSVDSEDTITVETLILDFNEDIYDQEIAVEFHRYIRPIKKMESLEAVQLQVERDSLVVRELFVMQEVHKGFSCKMPISDCPVKNN